MENRNFLFQLRFINLPNIDRCFYTLFFSAIRFGPYTFLKAKGEQHPGDLYIVFSGKSRVSPRDPCPPPQWC
jgi:hypothetical protein